MHIYLCFPGMYRGVGNRAITFRGAPKSLLALTDASTTVIDAQLADRGLIFNSGETYFSYLSGAPIHSPLPPSSLLAASQAAGALQRPAGRSCKRVLQSSTVKAMLNAWQATRIAAICQPTACEPMAPHATYIALPLLPWKLNCSAWSGQARAD